jgi:hypothetical protein
VGSPSEKIYTEGSHTQEGCLELEEERRWHKINSVYTHTSQTHAHTTTVKKLQLLRSEHIIFNNVFKNNI